MVKGKSDNFPKHVAELPIKNGLRSKRGVNKNIKNFRKTNDFFVNYENSSDVRNWMAE